MIHDTNRPVTFCRRFFINHNHVFRESSRIVVGGDMRAVNHPGSVSCFHYKSTPKKGEEVKWHI